MTGSSGGFDDAAWRPPPAPVLPPAPAESLAGYDQLVEIGRGGDSVVYRARDVALNREVAIKVLLVDDPARMARFAREVEITVDLGRQHPNIVNVLAVGTTDSGRPAIVMDHHEAGSLHDRLRSRGPLPPEEVAKLGVVLADALAFAHGRGVLHRDVKPQNVLVLPTSWVLADFGIARLADSEHTASVETFTYRHASPQILDGLSPSAADDIWSLGSTLYTLLDGRPPFASDDPDEDSALAYLRRARTEPPRPLRVPGVERLAPVIDRCLVKDTTQRWQSAAELRDALADTRVRAWEPGTGPAPATQQRPHPGPGPRPLRPPEPLAPAAEPLALSVLAHAPVPVRDVDATSVRAPAPDGTPTGAAPAGSAGVPADRPSTPPVEDGPPPARVEDPDVRRRRRVVTVLGATALVVGLGLGVAGATLRSEDPGRAPVAAPRSTGGPVPTLAEEPTQTGPPQLDRADPRLAFEFSKLVRDGSVLEMAWTETASEGTGTYTLVQTVPEIKPLHRWPAGTSEASLTFDMVEGQRYCFVMTVSPPTGELGITPRRCI